MTKLFNEKDPKAEIEIIDAKEFLSNIHLLDPNIVRCLFDQPALVFRIYFARVIEVQEGDKIIPKASKVSQIQVPAVLVSEMSKIFKKDMTSKFGIAKTFKKVFRLCRDAGLYK